MLVFVYFMVWKWNTKAKANKVDRVTPIVAFKINQDPTTSENKLPIAWQMWIHRKLGQSLLGQGICSQKICMPWFLVKYQSSQIRGWWIIRQLKLRVLYIQFWGLNHSYYLFWGLAVFFPFSGRFLDDTDFTMVWLFIICFGSLTFASEFA